MTAQRHMLAIRPQVASADVINWLDRAACAEVGPGLWDDQSTEGARQKERREESAKAICAKCPVIAECLAHAIGARMRGGIWGGLTEAERDAGTPTPAPAKPEPVLACGDKIGTGAGEMRHHRAGDTAACPTCLAGSAKEKAERKERQRGERIRARDYMAMQAELAAAIVPDPEWVTSARLTLLNLEARKASA